MSRMAAKGDKRSEILGLLEFHGITVPPVEPIAFRDGDMMVIPVAEADGDRGDLIITPDQPDLEDVADGILSVIRDCEQTFPGRRNWRRWKLTRRVSTWLYVLGITASGGRASSNGRDPVGTWIYDLPRWRSVLHGRRCYVLGLPMWWWSCQRRQGLSLHRHRPLRPWAFGVCAACVPCPTCGEPYECGDSCPEVTGVQA